MSDKPSPEAFEYLKSRRGSLNRRELFYVAKLLDEFHADRMKRDEEANRKELAANIRDWVSELQPDNLQNCSTSDLQDELQRRQNIETKLRCPHNAPWDDCPDCRH